MNRLELAKSMLEPIRCGGMEYVNGIAYVHIGNRSIPYFLIQLFSKYNCFDLLYDIINKLNIFIKNEK